MLARWRTAQATSVLASVLLLAGCAAAEPEMGGGGPSDSPAYQPETEAAAAPAHPDGKYGVFAQALDSRGIVVSPDTGGSDAFADAICAALDSGTDPVDVEVALMSNTVTGSQARAAVFLAVRYVCPEHKDLL